MVMLDQRYSAVCIFFSVCKWATAIIIEALLSFKIVFSLHLLAETVKFRLLNWTNCEASFYWPATVGAKFCGIRELKTTIQTTFCHSCSPHLYSALQQSHVPTDA
jgi:hypothetical protein